MTIVAVLAVSPAFGQNLGFLRDGPMQFMQKPDVAMMMKNFNEALDHNPDGHTSAWLNAATGASGTATPLSTGTEKGMKCRRVEITNTAGGQSGRGQYLACMTKTGWKFAN
jgi:surface antigen